MAAVSSFRSCLVFTSGQVCSESRNNDSDSRLWKKLCFSLDPGWGDRRGWMIII